MTKWNGSRRIFLKSLGLGAAAMAASCAVAPKADKDRSRPNVVLIMTDDQGYGDFGATGNPIIETPNVDAMASRSGSMENFYNTKRRDNKDSDNSQLTIF